MLLRPLRAGQKINVFLHVLLVHSSHSTKWWDSFRWLRRKYRNGQTVRQTEGADHNISYVFKYGFIAYQTNSCKVKFHRIPKQSPDIKLSQQPDHRLIDIDCSKKQVSMIRKYHSHTLQANPWYRKEESKNTNRDKISGKKLM